MKAAAADPLELVSEGVGNGLPLIACDEDCSGLQLVASIATVPVRRSALTRHPGVLRKEVRLAVRPT